MQNLVAILGTNASGESELGLRLANHLGGEVVSAGNVHILRRQNFNVRRNVLKV